VKSRESYPIAGRTSSASRSDARRFASSDCRRASTAGSSTAAPASNPTDVKGREARVELDRTVRAAMVSLLPGREPRLPRRRPLRFIGDLLTGPADLERRRVELGE